MGPDLESNRQPFGPQASTQSTEPHQPGLTNFFLRGFSTDTPDVLRGVENTTRALNLKICVLERISCFHFLTHGHADCVATLQGQAGSQKNICADGKIFTELLGCLACLYSWVGKPYTPQAACLSACRVSWPLLPSMAPIMAPIPLHVSHHHHPQQVVPTCLSTRGEQSWQDARNYITQHNSVHVSPFHVMGTVYWTQSQSYENTTYQALPSL